MAYQQYQQQFTVEPAPAAATAQPTYAAPAANTVQYAPATMYTPAPVQQYQPAPAPQYQPAPVYNNYGHDEIRTVFVTGFPTDVRERELQNMCRFMQGFEAASMKLSQHGMPQGFILFKYGAAAHGALAQLNGLPFDDGVMLRCELAKKNMYIRNDERPAKAYRSGPGPSAGPYGGGGGGYGGGGGGYGGGGGGGGAYGGGYDRNADNPPCDTLFIGNLSVNVQDSDIESYFQNVAGDKYDSCKVMRHPHGRVSALVKFIDTATAQQIHASEQGKEIPNSDRGPMRIQFSKNPLNSFGGGKRPREESTSYVTPGGPPPPQEAPLKAEPDYSAPPAYAAGPPPA